MDQLTKFILCGASQRVQALLDRTPDECVTDIVIVVAIDTSRPSYISPGDLRMARFKILRQSPGGLGNDLQAPDDGIDRASIALELLE